MNRGAGRVRGRECCWLGGRGGRRVDRGRSVHGRCAERVRGNSSHWESEASERRRCEKRQRGQSTRHRARVSRAKESEQGIPTSTNGGPSEQERRSPLKRSGRRFEAAQTRRVRGPPFLPLPLLSVNASPPTLQCQASGEIWQCEAGIMAERHSRRRVFWPVSRHCIATLTSFISCLSLVCPGVYRVRSILRMSSRSLSSCSPFPPEASNGSSGLLGSLPNPCNRSSTHLVPATRPFCRAQSACETMACSLAVAAGSPEPEREAIESWYSLRQVFCGSGVGLSAMRFCRRTE